MFVRSSRMLSSFVATVFVASAALAGCGDAPREEGIERRMRALVVVQRPSALASSAAVPLAALPAAPASAQPARPRASAVAAARPRGDGKSLAVKKLVLATDVEKDSREPQGVGTSFKQGEFEKLYAFVELANPGDEAEVLVSFEPPSARPAKGNVRLDVGTSPRWRTWASSRGVQEKGEWSAVVTAPDGRELAREKFVIL